MDPLRVGVIGCGNISGIYFENLNLYKPTTVVACADLNAEAAQKAAEKYSIPRVLTPDELLADSEVELVLNLTVPKAHGPVNAASIAAGKHVYVEKPLALSRAEADPFMAAANAKNLLTGGAPDTFMGAGIQTCRKLIEDGAIGEPIGVNAFMMGHGPEGWHPNPEFYYEKGGGPLFDMGPYYLTALINLMGSVKSVQSMARATFETRTIGNEAKKGKIIPVETPTHIVGLLEFGNGAIGQVTMSFDVWHHQLPHIEIYGTEGSLSVPDPNGFGGDVKIRKASQEEWEIVPLTHGYSQNSRGIGVMDMAYAIRTGRQHRASGALTYHVLDIMQGLLESAEAGSSLALTSHVDKPAPLATNLPADDLTE